MSEEKTLWLWSSLPKNPGSQDWKHSNDSVENVARIHMGGHTPASFDKICSGVHPPYSVRHDIDLLGELAKLGKPGAKVNICEAVLDQEDASGKLKSQAQLISQLKLGGLVHLQDPVEVELNDEMRVETREALGLGPELTFKILQIECQVPNFLAGSSRPLSFASKINTVPKSDESSKAQVWSLNLDDEEVDLVDPDTLLDQDDLTKPDPSSLRVCGTTGQRKACKDCSCGLREELESSDGKEPQTKKSVTSSCGSCYLGDAFRCASCPYLGMPAFKPGEKIQLSERQLNPDM